MFVRQQIGPQAGQIIEMPYVAAQNCLAAGTAIEVTDAEIAEAGLMEEVETPPAKAESLPPGYRVEHSEGGGYDILDPGGFPLTSEIDIPNLSAARSFAWDHYEADLEAAKQPAPTSEPEPEPIQIEWDKEWRDAHWATQVKLAKQFDPSVSRKEEAVAVLESVEARRDEAEKAEKAKAEEQGQGAQA